MTQTKVILSLSLLSMASVFALNLHADQSPKKAQTQIDFNKMIDDNNTTDLHEDMSAKMDDKKDSETETKVNADKSKVLDFVDVEMGLGKDRPLVDRRFNSVGEPRVVTETN